MVEKPDTLDQLGLTDKPDIFRAQTYYDVEGTNVANRATDRYEQDLVVSVADNISNGVDPFDLSVSGVSPCITSCETAVNWIDRLVELEKFTIDALVGMLARIGKQVRIAVQ